MMPGGQVFSMAGNFASKRRAIKMATAGARGKRERAFTVQLQKAVKINVPATHRNNNSEGALRWRKISITASPNTHTPPVAHKIIWIFC